MATKKTNVDDLKKELFYKNESCFEKMSSSEIKKGFDYCEEYKTFLDKAKTEREFVIQSIAVLEKNGFKPYKFGSKVKAGEKYFYNINDKALSAFVIGKNSLENGVYISAAHMDSPRVDLKPNPLYEQDGMAFFKTHYYGGIKKYQWTTVPLALHGVVSLKDGTNVEINVGEKDDDPIFYIDDLLIHLSGDQMRKSLGDGISGEQLNVLVGSIPYDTKTSDAIKLNILKILHDKYNITESDFLSAEISAVPAMKARDVGFDKSMIAAYGHDDKVCSYTALTALIEASNNPQNTIMVMLSDKEEIGSEGISGLQCEVFFDVIADLAKTMKCSDAVVRANSKCLSADVNACYDPNFGEVYERRNSCYLNKGVVLTKYTGSRGKSGTNDAPAEFMAFVRNIFDNADVVWQSSELGKVDQGGGGTVAKFISKKNVKTVDLGVPVISMHAPYELVSKLDVYQTHKAVAAFYKA